MPVSHPASIKIIIIKTLIINKLLKKCKYFAFTLIGNVPVRVLVDDSKEMEYSIQQLFTKYLGGKCTTRELETLMTYFKDPGNELLLRQLIHAEMGSDQTDQSHVPDLEMRLNAIHTSVQRFIHTDRPAIKLWPGFKSIAAAVVLLVAGVVYITHREQPTVLMVNSAENITPGKKSATLTLANGTKVLLNDVARGEVAKQTGVIITKMANGSIAYQSVPGVPANTIPGDAVSYNNLSTANGELYTIILPDGSAVTLNAASSIKYPASFAGLKERKIELTGEAYFVVKHNHQQPFRVITKGQQVEDIGTEFNINSYTDEVYVKTTLISGSAQVTSGKTDVITLIPSQQATLTGNALKISLVDTRIFTAWKDGVFAYKNTPLQEVMRQVERWYNVKIVYEDKDLLDKRLTGSVSRYDTITGILNAIGYTAKVRFKVESKTITIFKAD